MAHIKAETWYWLRFTTTSGWVETLPGLPYLDEHGEVQYWDTYLGKVGCLTSQYWGVKEGTVEVLKEIERP